jgi:RNA polymerase-binding transcription factor DksA
MTMASARRKSAGGGSAKKSKPAAKAKGPGPVRRTGTPSKPVAKAKPAVKAKTSTAPAPKPVAKPVKAAIAKPAAKPAPVAAKKVVGKPAVPGKKVIGKPAVPGKKVVGIPAVPAKPVRVGPPRLVPATAEARLKAIKPPTGKKAVNRAPAEVRPLGVLPLESQAKPRFAPPRPAAPPVRSSSNRTAPSKTVVARKPDEGLGPDDVKHFETRLLAERVRIMKEMGHIESTILKVNPRDSAGELSGYSFHMADAGTDSMEREKAFDIASKEGRLLMEIDDALRRLYGGTYGICEVSGKPISRARLEALPWARLSLDEQEKLEREQRAGRLAPSTE